MAYQTGTSTGPADLLAKIKGFAADLGWSINRDWDSGSKLLLQSPDGSQFVGIHATATDMYLRGATGVDTNADWDAQPGISPRAWSNEMPGPYAAYHLFGSANYIHCVVELTAGIFKHIVFGGLALYAPVIGGAYVGAIWWRYGGNYYRDEDYQYHSCLFDYNNRLSSSNSYGHTVVRADIDGASDAWAHFGDSTNWSNPTRAAGPARSRGFCSGLFNRSPNTLNALTALIPIYVLVERPSNLFSPLGTVRDMRYCNCANITPGDTITIGGDEWMVFPFIQKDGGTDAGDLNSGHYAYAYKKVV